LRRCLEDDHGLCLAWLYSVARQHSVTIDSDRQNVFGGLQARLANVLLSYGDAFGQADGQLLGIDHPLSYNKLAHQVGCTRRTIIRVMNQLQRFGAVKRAGDCWVIDAERLAHELTPGRLSLAHSFHDLNFDA
jgi:CRP-like cAMP-binding protein